MKFLIYFIGTDPKKTGKIIDAENMNSAKWIFALDQGLKSLSYIKGSRDTKTFIS